jgi:alanyl-tRNA synthetase
VSIRYAGEEDARALPLRKASQRTGTLRLIEIDGLDLSACGGTHVARTGAIGSIVVSAWERFKGGQRLEFLCGGRALSRFQVLRDATAASGRLVSAVPQDLPAAIERLLADAKAQRRALLDMQEALAAHEAGALADAAEAWGSDRVVLQVLDGDVTWLKALASNVVQRAGHMAILVSASAPVLVVAARAPDVGRSCQQLIAGLSTAFGGRGGGRPDLAQCGGLQATPDQVVAAARNFLSRPE